MIKVATAELLKWQKATKGVCFKTSQVIQFKDSSLCSAMKILTGILLVLLSHALDFGFASPARDGGRIVGGFPIPLSAAPYQISLLYRGYHQCGGKAHLTVNQQVWVCSNEQTNELRIKTWVLVEVKYISEFVKVKWFIIQSLFCC